RVPTARRMTNVERGAALVGPNARGLIATRVIVPRAGLSETSSPVWAIWANLICQNLAIVLTAFLWGQWQAKLSNNPLGFRSPYLTKILATTRADAAHQC